MSKVSEIRLDFARTFVPPGGDRYQPVKIAAGLTVTIDDGDDPVAVRQTVQAELRALLEETYRAQHKPKNGTSAPAQADPAAPTQSIGGFKPAQPPEDKLEY